MFFDFFGNPPTSTAAKFYQSHLPLIWGLSMRQFHDVRGAFSSPNHPFLQSFVNIFGNSPIFLGFMEHPWAPIVLFFMFYKLFRKFADFFDCLVPSSHLSYPTNFAECVAHPQAPTVLFRQVLSTPSEGRQLRGIHGTSSSSSRTFPLCLKNFFGNSSNFRDLWRITERQPSFFDTFFDLFGHSSISSTVKSTTVVYPWFETFPTIDLFLARFQEPSLFATFC